MVENVRAQSGAKSTSVAGPFGRYEIVERIATGGMAEILLARSSALGGVNRICVIKRILPQYSRDLTFVSMFIDEARITIGLEHKNVVRLFDFGQVDGVYFMAIEYVDGTDLAALMRTHLQAGKAVPPRVAAFIARSLCAGLHHAHSLQDTQGRALGIIHRDVSPQNVLLGSRGEVKLADFGIAAARHKLTLTSPGTVLGKAAYMAPEQATGRGIDFKVDIWAAGVIFHEMLSGERLFADETPLATLQRVFHDPIEKPSTIRQGVPASLDEIALKALTRDPKRRYATALSMQQDLDAWLAAAGHFDDSDLAHYLAELEWAHDTQQRPDRGTRPADTDNERTAPRAAVNTGDHELDVLYQGLHARPDLWTLVAIGDRYAAQQRKGPAVSAYRTAALVFAYRGLLVQALCAHWGARAFLDDEQAFRDLLQIADLAPGKRKELVKALAVVDEGGFWKLLQEVDPQGLGSEADSPAMPVAVPLFGLLGPREVARLALAAQIRRVKAGEIVIREGDQGDALYAIGRGRFVVSCEPGRADEAGQTLGDDYDDDGTLFERGQGFEAPLLRLPQSTAQNGRISLAGLADGDFFGEFSFLAERPRSATIESIGPGIVLELNRKAVESVTALDEAFTEPLLRFYKERVVELMMAKSPVFSMLEAQDRKALIDSSALVDFSDQALIVVEGTQNDALFFIKRGEVEVFQKDDSGVSIFINKLGQGQFFGEIAALRGTPRTVSVRAMGDVTLFQIERRSLLAIVERQPQLKGLFEATIRARTAETRERVLEHERVFIPT